MEIRLRLHGTLRRFGDAEGRVVLYMGEGVSVEDVLNQLGIPEGFCQAAIKHYGMPLALETKLRGDRVELVLIPPIGGG